MDSLSLRPPSNRIFTVTEQKFELERVPRAPVTDEELLADLRRVASENHVTTVTQETYDKTGVFNFSTVVRRFDSWNKALLGAGLEISNTINISDQQLFENILVLWQHYGRQPRKRDLSQSPSMCSEYPYRRRFGSWMSALESFVKFANGSEIEPADTPDENKSRSRKTARDPSLRLRFKVLKRDNFRCRQCGASPARSLGVELHVDHMVPWSKGGPTTFENLQTLCSECNLGKGDLHSNKG